MGEVKIQWLGHSCMAVEEDGYRIVFDPYEDGSVDGLAPLRTEGDLVLASHGHADHNGTSCVRIRPGAKTKKNPFRITELPSYHDEVHGAKRGANTIRILDDGSYRIAHMGDIGCALTDAQKEALSHLTVMMVPVGGYFTLEPAAIHALVEELAPEIVIPMHYRGEGFGYSVIGTLSAYTDLVTNVREYAGDTLVLPKDLAPQGGKACHAADKQESPHSDTASYFRQCCLFSHRDREVREYGHAVRTVLRVL